MSNDEKKYYIDVVLPLNLWNNFTYEVSQKEYVFLKKGMRVAVSFGKQIIQTAIVYKKHRNKPVHYETKPILHIIDNQPVINENQWKLYQFISGYYLTPLGLVIKAALPASFMLESETYLIWNENEELDETYLTDDEYIVLETVKMKKMVNIKTLQELFDKKKVFVLVNNLMKKGFVKSLQEIKEKYKPKTETYIQLSAKWKGENINTLFEQLQSKAPKQHAILMQFFMLQRQGKPVLKKQLLQQSGAGLSSLQSLISKGVLYEIQTDIDRIRFEQASERTKDLSPEQAKALQDIQSKFLEEKPILLHGVTSSGKTELYIHLIQQVLRQGKQVLYLVPEIALTTQLVQRLVKVFGNSISVYHSKYSQQERREVWLNVLNHQPQAQLILGARSAVFLPFHDLGLVIVDEEHEASYKQQSPAPRYQARDMAVVLSKFHQADIVLGSATPSVESFYNVKIQKYLLTELTGRFGGVQLPHIEIIDLKEALRKKRTKGNFSNRVLEAIQATLDQKKQVIVFQNRRGYAPVAQCTDCGHVMECPHCDVSLTLHKYQHQLKCHYCGYHTQVPVLCPVCGNPSIDYKGIGTEQIQQDLQLFFDNVVVDRLDSDTTRRKNSFANILSRFQNMETDILVGTQMLVKGLDFANVGLVVVMSADQLLYYPDFRADERSFQMLMQVAGRAGRKKEQGKVLIQTFNPDHPILQLLLQGDYKKMYEQQIAQRKDMAYPPFVKIVNLQVKDKNLQKSIEAAEWLQKSFSNFFSRVLGPSDALIPRIKDRYIKEILIKLPLSPELPEQKKIIQQILHSFSNIPYFKSVRVVVDVDPY